MTTPNLEIIQIIPADGWEAQYNSGNFVDVVDVACFALHHKGKITAMIMDPTNGSLIYATSRRGFLKCIKRESREYL